MMTGKKLEVIMGHYYTNINHVLIFLNTITLMKRPVKKSLKKSKRKENNQLTLPLEIEKNEQVETKKNNRD